MASPRNDLYPDLAPPGGLGAALQETARLGGYDVGPLPLGSEVAHVGTARGFLTVEPAAERRLFRLTVHIPGFTWEIGATDDLRLLVEAVGLWRHGTAYEEMAARCAFLDLGEFVRALEAGEPTATQWADLLSAEFHRRQRNLLRRLHADEVLRTMFPTVSHGAVRLRLEPLDPASRQVLVHEEDAGRYAVLRVGAPRATWEDVRGANLIPTLRSALTGT